jgi:biotin synthase-like enzyme
MIPKDEIRNLINQGDELFEKARQLASERPLVLSAPLIMSRACQAEPLCRYCNWRAYRGVMKNSANVTIGEDEAISRSQRIKKSGVDRVHVLSGWMRNALPQFYFDCVSAIKKNTGLAIIADFGSISREDLIRLKEAGVDFVLCGLETANVDLFRMLKPGDNYEVRLRTLRSAKELGFKTATNYIIGLGESLDDLDASMRLVEELGISLLSLTSFVPTPFTETETWERPRPYLVSAVVASARCCLPEIDITASFGCDNTSVNYAWGIKSGANAFGVVLRSPLETPALAGDEISNIRVMWDDSKTINSNKVPYPTA